MFLATSNEGKILDFQRLGVDFPVRAPRSSREADGTIHEIVIQKARDEDVGAIVEDTCLYVDGHPEVGNRIKYEEHRMPEMIGCRALWVTGIAARHEGRIDVFVGRTAGVIVPPAHDPHAMDFSPKDFGRFFRPDGSDTTYSALRLRDGGVLDSRSADCSARGRAIRAFLRGAVEFSVPAIGAWGGAWQSEGV